MKLSLANARSAHGNTSSYGSRHIYELRLDGSEWTGTKGGRDHDNAQCPQQRRPIPRDRRVEPPLVELMVNNFN